MTTEEAWEDAWEVIARVRDAYPRVHNDAPTDEIVEALADAGLLARTEAWEDNARAEAERRLKANGLPLDGPLANLMKTPALIEAFIEGAQWAAARAETTAEDMLDSLPYFTFEDDDVAPDEEFVRKADVAHLLAAARCASPKPRPTSSPPSREIRQEDNNK